MVLKNNQIPGLVWNKQVPAIKKPPGGGFFEMFMWRRGRQAWKKAG
jgi:hypothetical protein